MLLLETLKRSEQSHCFWQDPLKLEQTFSCDGFLGRGWTREAGKLCFVWSRSWGRCYLGVLPGSFNQVYLTRRPVPALQNTETTEQLGTGVG